MQDTTWVRFIKKPLWHVFPGDQTTEWDLILRLGVMNPCLDLGPSPKTAHCVYENTTKSVKVYNPKRFWSQALKLQPRFHR